MRFLSGIDCEGPNKYREICNRKLVSEQDVDLALGFAAEKAAQNESFVESFRPDNQR